MRAWVRIWARFLLFVVGFYRIRLSGWDHLASARSAKAILVFNHESYVDAPVMVSLFAPSGVAKSGIASMPLVGRFAKALQFLFVERKGSMDRPNRHTVKGDARGAVARRAADTRWGRFYFLLCIDCVSLSLFGFVHIELMHCLSYRPRSHSSNIPPTLEIRENACDELKKKCFLLRDAGIHR